MLEEVLDCIRTAGKNIEAGAHLHARKTSYYYKSKKNIRVAIL
jgi:hypothetical protein